MMIYEPVDEPNVNPECVCPVCWLDAEPNSEMCGACAYLGCTEQKSQHD